MCCRCNNDSKYCKYLCKKIRTINHTTKYLCRKIRTINHTTKDTNTVVKEVNVTTKDTNAVAKNTNECCKQVLKIVENIQNQIAPIIDPVTGCQVSSQEVIDLRNLYNETIFKVGPQSAVTAFALVGTLLPAPQFSDYEKWPDWTPEGVNENINILDNTVDVLNNANPPGMFEQERQELIYLANSFNFWLVDPRRALTSCVGGVFEGWLGPMGGQFWLQNSALGVNLYWLIFRGNPDVLGQITRYWNNYSVSLTQFGDYLINEGLNKNVVYSPFDLERLRNVVYPLSVEQGKTIEETVAFQPFLGGTVEQQNEGKAAFQAIRDATDVILDILRPGGPYSNAVETIRATDQNPGLSAPGMPLEVREFDYNFALKINANTILTPTQIRDLGLAQVADIQDQIVQTVNSIPGITPKVANYAEYNNLIRNDPSYTEQFFFVNEITVGQYKREIESMIFEAFSAQTASVDNPTPVSSFQHYPQSPLKVDMFPGFGAANYTGPQIQADGTGTVTLRAAEYNSPSDAEDINPNTLIPLVTRSFNSSTVFHESIPGHHTQIAMNNELPCKLVSGALNLGASEGWALYGEKVAALDMNLANPESRPFRYLSYLEARLFRAARLVIDSGLHAFGWSRQQAVDYYTNNTVELIGFIETEIDRYITWPGQAVGYLAGSLVIEGERTRAEVELGSDFSLSEYHDVLIRYGAPPESLVVQLTDFYINSKKNGTFGKEWPPIVRQPNRPVLPSVIPSEEAGNLTRKKFGNCLECAVKRQ